MVPFFPRLSRLWIHSSKLGNNRLGIIFSSYHKKNSIDGRGTVFFSSQQLILLPDLTGCRFRVQTSLVQIRKIIGFAPSILVSITRILVTGEVLIFFLRSIRSFYRTWLSCRLRVPTLIETCLVPREPVHSRSDSWPKCDPSCGTRVFLFSSFVSRRCKRSHSLFEYLTKRRRHWVSFFLFSYFFLPAETHTHTQSFEPPLRRLAALV